MAKKRKPAPRRRQRTLAEHLDEEFEGDFLAFREALGGLMPSRCLSEIPSWLTILGAVKRLGIIQTIGIGDPQRAPTDNDIADMVYCAAIDYQRGRFFEARIKEQTEKPEQTTEPDQRLPEIIRKHLRTRGVQDGVRKLLRTRGSLRDNRKGKVKGNYYAKQSKSFADTSLALWSDRIVERVKTGSNEKWGWLVWDELAEDPRERRKPGIVPKVFNLLLLIIDSARLLPDAPEGRRPPDLGFFEWVQQKYIREQTA